MFELEQIRLGLTAYDEKLEEMGTKARGTDAAGNGGFTLTSLARRRR